VAEMTFKLVDFAIRTISLFLESRAKS